MSHTDPQSETVAPETVPPAEWTVDEVAESNVKVAVEDLEAPAKSSAAAKSSTRSKPTIDNNHELWSHHQESVQPKPPDNELGCCGKCADCGRNGCCGLPPMPHDFEEIPEGAWMSEGDKYVLMLWSVLVAIGLVGVAIYEATGNPIFEPPPATWVIEVIFSFVITHILFGITGFFVVRCGLNVAVSRKIMHFILMPFQIFSATSEVETEEQLQRTIFYDASWRTAGIALCWLSWNVQCRKRCRLLDMSYRSLERPADRPFNCFWAMLQVISTPQVLVPFKHFAVSRGNLALLWIPTLSVGLGDGLAEPVGRMFGKHKYMARALCTSKQYVRSYEGSAVVFLFTLIGVILAHLSSSEEAPLTTGQTVVLAALTPLCATLVEAFSPHTLDNQFLFGINFFIVWLVVDVLGPV